MKKLLYPFMMLVGTMFLITSCETDPVGPGDPNADPPLVTLDGFVVTLAAPGDPFLVGVSAIPGDANLRTVAVYEDDVLIDPSRFLFGGVAAGANPIALSSDDVEGFMYDMEVTSHTDVAVRTYRFEVIDENNNSDSENVTVTTQETVTPPTFTYMGGMNITTDPGSLIALQFDAVVGSGTLSTVEVLEDGALMTDFAGRLFYGDLSTEFDANPYALPAADQAGFSMRTIFVRAPNAAGTFSYDVRLTASDGETATSSIDVTTGTVGTPISTTLQGVLLNSAGPAGTGGLNLDTGTGTGSEDPAAEIRDLGIDISLPGSDWLRTIAGVNNFEVRTVTPGANGLPETFSFASTTTKEAIIGAFNSSSLNNEITNVGDLYAVSDGTSFYLLETIEINETATPGDNTDNYVFDVKF